MSKPRSHEKKGARRRSFYQNFPVLPEWLPVEWLVVTLPPPLPEERFSVGFGCLLTVLRRKWSDWRVRRMDPGTV